MKKESSTSPIFSEQNPEDSSLLFLLFQNNPNGIALVNYTSQEIIKVNQTLISFLEIDHEEILKMKWSELDLNFNDDVYQANLRSLHKGKIKHFDTIHPFKSKTKKGMNLSIKSSMLISKEKKYLLFQLEKSKFEPYLDVFYKENTFSQIFDQSPIGIMIGHRVGRLKANPRLCEMTGYTEKEWLEMDTAVFSHPDDEVIFLQKRKELYDNNIPLINLQKRYIRKDQSVFWANVFVFPIYSSHGALESDIAFITDITKEHEANQEIILSNEKYFDLFENMYDALVVLDEKGSILDANLAAQRLFDLSLVKLKKMNIQDLIYNKDLDQFNSLQNELRTAGYFSNYMIRIISKNKEIRTVQINSNAIFQSGKFSGSRNIVRDITEELETQQKQKELVNKLSNANQELQEFAYIVSHDLKAPLRAIASLAQWLAEDYKNVLDDTGKMQLDLLNKRVERMHNFIEGILEYSRVSREKEKIEKVDLKKILLEVLDSLAPPSTFKINIPKSMPFIYCQRLRIFQLFQNLISNAIKYNDKEEGQIDIRLQEELNLFRISVTDNGPGIDKKYHDKVFQIFQTLQSRDAYESTGIGLTIVKRIVEMHGGEIQIFSDNNQGATFEFTIPKLLDKTID